MSSIRQILLTVLLAAALSGCVPNVSTHGNMLSQTRLKQITAGVSTRADVESYWGPPSTTSPFDNNTWYYIGETDSQEGVFAPKVVKREMVKVTFDANDKVTNVELLDNKLAKNVPFESRITPTAGKEYTAAQQFIGDLGKFNNASKPTAGP